METQLGLPNQSQDNSNQQHGQQPGKQPDKPGKPNKPGKPIKPGKPDIFDPGPDETIPHIGEPEPNDKDAEEKLKLNSGKHDENPVKPRSA